MDDNQEIPNTPPPDPRESPCGFASPSTFSLILDFKGKATLQTASAGPAPLVRELNGESAAIGNTAAEEIRSYLKPQLPAAEVSVTIDFALGSIRWSGVVSIVDHFARITENAAFSEYVRKAIQFVLNKAIRSRIEQHAVQQNAAVKSGHQGGARQIADSVAAAHWFSVVVCRGGSGDPTLVSE
jgi:hypothetical protein